MKPRCSLAILSLLVSLLLAGSAHAWDEAKLKAEVQGLLDKVAASFEKRDVRAVVSYSAPGATIDYRNGPAMSVEKWGQTMGKDVADWLDVRSKYVVEKVWPKGRGKAGAVYRERHEFTRASDPGHKYVIAGRFRAMMTKTPKGWRFTRFKNLGLSMTRDGKPYRPKAASK